jgi:hypothetical protein
MTETSDWLIFWVVAGARFLLPLTIPRYPVPGIIASLLLDAVDQTIFQQFTGLDLEGYQGYDKALDIYYLAIAYISTLRNWANHFAFQVSRFLFYWRLVGVALFELTHLRPLLLIFPNTFEYFFIFYEVCRLRWDPKRMMGKVLIGAAAFIWIVIKLPQEYWIHIGQIDTTDWIKTSLFRVPVDTPWSEIFKTWPWVFLLAFVVVALVAFIVTVNTALSHWLARRGFGWAFTLWQSIVLGVVNLGGLLVYTLVRSRFDAPVSIANVLFFALLLTLLITLFDRYRQVYLMRFSPSA